MKPFLLLAIRAEDAAADNEYESFLAFAGLGERDLRRARLEQRPLGNVDLQDWSGILLGGGPFNSSDPEDSKSPVQRRVEADLRGLLDGVISADFPFLGACYGIGALGSHQGAVVDRRYAEPVGCVPVTLTGEGRQDPLLRGLPATFDAFTGHKEAISRLPQHAVLLAGSPACPVQAFRIGSNVYATQFHPELDAAGLCTRIDVYKNAGYFDPGQAAGLKALARRSNVTHPPAILRRFAHRYAGNCQASRSGFHSPGQPRAGRFVARTVMEWRPAREDAVAQIGSGPAILVEGLTKSFGDVHALRGIDLSVPRGTVLGVLGPNGAGKTTAVRILTTLLRPDAGRALVEGHDVVREAAAVRRSIGLSGQSAAIQLELTGRENLEIIGRLYHLSWPRARSRAVELLDQFDLLDAADRSAKNFSGGMQRRLDLAASLVGQPQVLFLDEPTTGLDPRSRLGMWDIIRSLVAGGTTTLLTTQYLDEADELADEIVVIDHGLVIAAGTAEELKGRVGGDVLEFTVPDRARVTDAVAAIAKVGEGEPHVDKETGVISVGVGGRGSEALIEAVRGLDAAGIETRGLALRRPSLDDVFLALTGHAAEEDEQPSGRRRGRKKAGDKDTAKAAS